MREDARWTIVSETDWVLTDCTGRIADLLNELSSEGVAVPEGRVEAGYRSMPGALAFTIYVWLSESGEYYYCRFMVDDKLLGRPADLWSVAKAMLKEDLGEREKRLRRKSTPFARQAPSPSTGYYRKF